MADLQKVSQVFTQFAYEQDPKQKVSQVYTQIAYENPPKLRVSQVFVQYAYEGTDRISPLSDVCAVPSDSISASLQAMLVASISDSVRRIIDEIYPPPVEATHFTGNISDAIGIIEDALSSGIVHSYHGDLSDTLEVIRDAITTGMINLETPVRWVAPIAITPRGSTLDPLYLAAHPVRHPSLYFEPRVKSYGTFTRAISAPAAFVKTGDVNISLVDSDNSIRQRIAAKTIRKALADVRLGPEGGSYSAFLRPCKREVGTITQPVDGELNMPLRDFVYDFFEEQIPPEIDTDRYPNLPESPAREFAPIVIGEVTAQYGAIPLFMVDTVNHGYMVARHICQSVDAVYRKRAGEDEFSLVGAGEYAVSNLEDYANNRFYCQVIFSADQADAEIRANVHGYYYSTTGLLKCTNFSDFILEIFQTVLGVDGGDKVNFGSFDTVRTQTAADGLACAGALMQKMTFGECLSQLQRSSNIDIFTDKNDRITVKYTTDDEEPTVHLDDLLRLYKGTISQSLADPAYNQIPYKYNWIPATDKWTEATFDNEGDQERLGEIVPEEPLQLYWVRDAATALAVVTRRAQYLDLDSFRFEAEIPLIPTVESIELADIATIEHFGGIKAGGYTAEQFKILELSMDIDKLKYRIKGIRRRLPPPSEIKTEFDSTPDGDGGGDGTDSSPLPNGISGVLAINCRPGPHYNNVEGELFAIWKNNYFSQQLKAWATDDFGASWAVVDKANQPAVPTEIMSYDCCSSDGLIHVATQEANGRVAYHIFDMASRTWTTVNEEVLAIANINNCCVSIDVRYPGGEPLIYFQGNRELVDGVLFQRGYYSIKSGGSWTAPVMVTPNPNTYLEAGSWYPSASPSRDCKIQRVIAGRENRMHFFYQLGTLMSAPKNEYYTTLNSSMVVGPYRFLSGGNWVYYPALHNMGGGFAVYDNHTKIAIMRSGGYYAARHDVLSEGTSLALLNTYNMEPALSVASITENPSGFICEHDGVLHSVSSNYGYFTRYSKSDDDGDNWNAALLAGEQYYYPYVYKTINCNGNVIKVRGQLYLSYFSERYYWVKVADLPYGS